MASGQQEKRSELEAKAKQGETVIPGGTGGKSVEAQEHLAEGRRKGGQTRKEQLGSEGYQEIGSKGGQEQMGSEGFMEMGRKGGLSTTEPTNLVKSVSRKKVLKSTSPNIEPRPNHDGKLTRCLFMYVNV